MMIDPITAFWIGIVLLFIAITYLIPAAPDPLPEACRQFYYFADCPGDYGECWEERIAE